MCPWASGFTFLSLDFYICKVEWQFFSSQDPFGGNW